MTEISLDVTIRGDNILESNETFQLSINSSSLPNRVTVDNPSVVTVTIVDNDCKLLTLYNVLLHICSYIYVHKISSYWIMGLKLKCIVTVVLCCKLQGFLYPIAGEFIGRKV